ncbi:tetratricopeptide repeat protein [Propylenella binzhouense]|uniref:Sel1 repeat family protein n=1 Tax=Propylenella binzhouense TaxID=2555902 RepID=A0A964T9D0_9HYPH|nr:tetratricopeptide repeat protein [Propylenella binzhouense]MYZ50189.1 sel1 repeat family protein [Propylenella binzhouense]
MRINSVLALVLAGEFVWAGAAFAAEAERTPSEAFRTGYAAYKKGDTAEAIEALNYAASKGHAASLWKLGRMYATGDGVTEDDRKALEIFSRIANDYADGNPHGSDAPYVADAFVTLGRYFRAGIPGGIVADLARARRYYAYAASYFGDSEAQYQLATMYLAGEGGEKSERQAARWFKLAARKGHVGAQAELGRLLYDGVGVERNPVRGLMWLSIAQISSKGDATIQAWHEAAFSAAAEGDRRAALALAEDWLKRRTASN